MGNDNCFKCSTVDGCLDECDNTEEVNSQPNWNSCKMRCSAHYSGQAQNPFQRCAIYKKKDERCWCATGCDNDSTNNITPWTEIPTEAAEAYIIGVISTLMILFIAWMICYACKRYKRSSGKPQKVNYAKVINVDSIDNEEIPINE
eukprot:313315_1